VSLAVESAQERLMYPVDYQSAASVADACDGKTTVYYNGSCQRRNNKCCGGRGYLGQVAGNIKWGRCIDPKTGKDCIGAAPKQTNQTNNCPIWCYAVTPIGLQPPLIQPSEECKKRCAPSAGGYAQKPLPPAPKGSPTGTPSSGKCKGCNFGDIGCETGKHFCEFQGWLAGSVGGLGLPVMIGGGAVILLLLLKR
jgi:hypothetical protein